MVYTDYIRLTRTNKQLPNNFSIDFQHHISSVSIQ